MKLRHNTKRILTAALAVWLSGIVVLFCCAAMPTKAASAEVESCPLAKKGHCAKTAAGDAEHFLGQSTSATFDCCAFPAKIFDKVRKLEKSPEYSANTATIKISAPQFFIVERVYKSPKIYQPFVHNRGGTHLRNCVFRI